jgi:HAD superfamily hydrolase (TIGR01484 family)
MKPIEELPVEGSQAISLVLTDIDDTLTSGGKLENEAYAALWRLYRAGLRVVPVTGRPAGWCDLIVRQWPVHAVIGENGAFVYYRETKTNRIQTFTHPSVASHEIKRRLDAVREAVLTEVPGCRVARDQFARLYDLAIDFREDPPMLSLAEAERIKAVCERFGAQAKISSIHVNAWFGDYDKVKTARLFLRDYWGLSEERQKVEVLFCGDSPNDEPMFDFFPNSCAVANIREFEYLLRRPPTYISNSTHGRGFAEIVDAILRKIDKAGEV